MIPVSISFSGPDAYRGALIASEEYKNIDIINYDDESYTSTSLLNVEKIIDSKSNFVIGHNESFITVSAATLYEINKKIMITPASTAKNVLKENYRYIFRTIPNDEIISKSLLNYCKKNDISKIMICYASHEYGSSFAKSFENIANTMGVSIVDKVSFSSGHDREFRSLFNRWSNYDFDAIMFIGDNENIITFTKIMSHFGLPIMCSDIADQSEIINKLRGYAENLVIPQLANRDSEKYKDFEKRFLSKFRELPSIYSAIAYDTLHILMQAAMFTESLDTEKIVDYLKSDKFRYKGILRDYSFDTNGDLEVESVDVIKIGKDYLNKRGLL
jgi:branched-chain amino acid transport system substrate-binding protein